MFGRRATNSLSPRIRRNHERRERLRASKLVAVLEAEPVVALRHRTSRGSDPRYSHRALGGHSEMAQVYKHGGLTKAWLQSRDAT
jgi:hypothetical protein